MYRDLLQNAETIADDLLVQALALGAEEGSSLDFDPISEDRLDEEAPPEDLMAILPADATQRQCIAAAAAGRSFVMDGPPGTGKSQTIANVIAELLATGKTVLFVSEKAAALEVVQRRLRHSGLGDYTLELHSHKATRKEVAQQLGAALTYHPAAPALMSDTAISQLRQRRQQLSERARAVNEVRQPLGRTLHQVIGRIAQLHALPQAPPPGDIDTGLSAAELARILTAAGELARSWGPVERGEDFLWRELRDVRIDASRAQRTSDQAQAALSRVRAVELAGTDASAALLRPLPRDFVEAESLLKLVRHIEHRRQVPVEWLTTDSLAVVEDRHALRSRQSATYSERANCLDEAVGSRWRELDVSAADQLNAAHGQLAILSVRCELPGDLPVAELSAVEQFARSSASLLREASTDARTIGQAFGLPTAGLTLSRALELAHLGSCAAEPARPEREWINPAVIDEVEAAATTLQPICAALVEHGERLGGVFTDEVLGLDLESLCYRFATVHTGLAKLGSAYRQDKKALAGVSRAGKANKTTIAMLPEALEWQKLTVELEAAERQHARLLGDHYYHGAESDFDTINRAVGTARRAIELAGRHVNVQALQGQLARGGAPDPQLVPRARSLTDALGPWPEQAQATLGQFGERLAVANLEPAATTCDAAAAAIEQMVAPTSRIERLAGRTITLAEAQSASRARADVGQIEDELTRAAEDDRAVLGPRYTGLASDWDVIRADIAWAEELRELCGAPLSGAAADRVQTAELRSSELDEALRGWERTRDALLEQFEDERARVLRRDLDADFAEAVDLLMALRETVGDIEEWIEHEGARRQLTEFGLSDVVAFCATHRVAAEAVPSIVERACLEGWVDSVVEHDMARLKHLRADQLDPIVEQFRQLDIELIERTSGRVIAACNARRPRTTIGAAGVIQREAQKQRRHMPVRKLLEEAGEVAQALKPCFMMSPLTVSQFLPPSLRFDAVVFDEASQVRPSDAVNCVYRGRQLIVAGDDKQLPPTSFFEAVSIDGDDEWEEEQFEQYESILKQSKSGGLRELPLRWHYRSQHEGLIAYSNESFYRGRLITFPGALQESDRLGVKLYTVPDGVYRRGTARDNPREAEAVADRVMHWAHASTANPGDELTVGVVAFSEAQAAAIEVALDRRREAAPELDDFFAEDRLDGFFVKNLENVQGDERDVMIFSIGYGRDEHGKLTMNFGPVNREGGQRRLNVAITRARQRVEVVSSIAGTEAEFNADLKEGVRHLRRYLDYAARGPAALALELGESGLDADSPFEEEVIRTIRSWGYDAVPQVGTAGYRVDIGVKHPAQSGQFALGIECDGWMYHSSKVARDRDRLRQEVLERLGWRIYRIWGTAWYRNRSEQEQRLMAAIAAAINDTGDSSVPSRRSEPTERGIDTEFEAVSLDEAPTWTVPYRVAKPTLQPRRLPEMHLPEAQRPLREVIEHVVTIEGPVLDSLVLRRVREAWGVGRAGRRIRDAFDTAVGALVRRGSMTVDRHGFLSIPETRIEMVRVPGGDPAARRGADEIPLAEMQLAVLNLARDARRVRRHELTFEVARLFGWNRRGPDIAAALDRAVDGLRRAADLDEDGEYLYIP
jgi:very-short-patch-repair endonuclease